MALKCNEAPDVPPFSSEKVQQGVTGMPFLLFVEMDREIISHQSRPDIMRMQAKRKNFLISKHHRLSIRKDIR